MLMTVGQAGLVGMKPHISHSGSQEGISYRDRTGNSDSYQHARHNLQDRILLNGLKLAKGEQCQGSKETGAVAETPHVAPVALVQENQPCRKRRANY